MLPLSTIEDRHEESTFLTLYDRTGIPDTPVRAAGAGSALLPAHVAAVGMAQAAAVDGHQPEARAAPAAAAATTEGVAHVHAPAGAHHRRGTGRAVNCGTVKL